MWPPCGTAASGSGKETASRPTRFQLPALLLLALLLPFPTQAQDLTIDLLPGITQQRNFEQAGRWHRQWVRTLPPEQDPYLLLVQGPQAWLDEAGQAQTPEQIAAANAPHLRALVNAARQRALLPDDEPLLTAARLVALLRPVPQSPAGPPGRNSRIWQAWEVLADAAHADTLSTSFAIVQALRDLGIPSRLARYPLAASNQVSGQAPDQAPSQVAFGVWLPDTVLLGTGLPDTAARSTSPSEVSAYPLRQGLLLPIIASRTPGSRPASGNQESELKLWTWEELLAPDWQPGGSPAATTSSRSTPDPTPDDTDLCAQARALGIATDDLDCPSETTSAPPHEAQPAPLDLPSDDEGIFLYLISAGLLALLAFVGWSSWRARQQRLARHRDQLADRERRRF